MTDIWFEEQDGSADYIPQEPLLRCIRAELHWDAQAKLEDSFCQLAELEHQVDQLCNQYSQIHQRLDKLLDAFYTQWLFSGSDQDVAEYLLNSVCYTLKMRSGSPTALALVLSHLLQRGGFDAQMALSQGEVMVHVAISNDEGYLIDPNSGQQSWYITPENEKEKQEEPLELVLGDEAVKLYLAQQKWAFIAVDKFSHALSCVELLMDLIGDDPYERRDRGYLLNQLNCPKMAKEDLQFFVDECPDDPAIEIIEHQIAELADHNNILH
ncbi:tetratricopeptide repeat protein [Pseudoalteromonas sp. JBTF-M23]|uniref:Tetratricopeptide repeat protein n=1 Tax=Pseudoalteromonas caenipelagi TaxID=2726988 RepID=A0A849VL77_9GAMM|nr:tetratricopeptide repeat protein [Pseudoalteromonas caenipelagi]NOU52524.1 tetratricopeptide repeat protein [Pseudoalteromonas caenipelagi]